MEPFRWKHALSIGALTVASLLSATGGGAQAAETIKVGFVLALSGPGSVIGKEMKQGADLALERLGGSFGDRPVEFIYEDSQRKPDVGKQAADKLVRSDKVNVVVGSAFSNVMMAINRTVTRRKTVLVSPNAAPAPLAGEQCSEYYFAVPFQNDQPAEGMGQYLTDNGTESAYILAPNYQAGRDLLAGFKRRFKGELVGEVYTPLEQTDFSAELTAIEAENPEAVFIFYPGGLGVQFVKQYEQAGLSDEIPLYTAFTVNGATLPAIGDAALGVHSASQWAVNLDNAANQAFVPAYQKKFGSTPSEFAAQAYDAINLIAGAVASIDGAVDSEALRAAMKTAPFESVRGDFRFNTNQHPIHDMHLLVVEKGENGELASLAKAVIIEDMVDAYVDQCPME